jgi:mono/diheme cytochrome c family protein
MMRLPSAFVIVALAAVACRERTEVPPGANEPGATGIVIAKRDDRVFAGGIAPPAERVTSSEVNAANAAQAGEKLFTGMNCDGCHGGGAVGAVGPSLTDGRWRYGGTDADIFRSIAEGRPKGMPAFAGVLQPPAIWRLVAYIKSLPAPKDVPTESWVDDGKPAARDSGTGALH